MVGSSLSPLQLNGRGGGGGGGGRDRFRKDFSWKSEERSSSSHHGRSNAPPSRHLWVGSLSHHMTESILSEQFLRFGEIESIAFQPGRSYAFVNFKKEEDALIAVKGLQGFYVAGLPLKIEFAKAERSLASAHDEEYQKRRDERGSAERETSLFQRDSRGRPSSLEPSNTEKSRMGDKNAEPSEVLWVGFPASLNVDEMVLRMAFSPFGELEKITAFPGRTYAFVQFRSVIAASRAKEALHGKLFNNPRVHIYFARSEFSGQEHGRTSMNDLFPPHFNSSGHPGQFPADYRQDRYSGNSAGEPRFRSPHFISDLESVDPSVTGFNRNNSLRTGGNGDFELLRMHGPGSQFGLSENIFKRHRSSPARERSSHPNDFPPEGHPYEDHSDLPADTFHFNEAKKLKMGSFPPNHELIAYPFSGSAQEKQFTGLPRPFMDFPEPETYDKKIGSGPFSYNRVTDHQANVIHPHGERDDQWKASNERFEAGSGSLPINPVQRQVSTPETHHSPLSKVWKWEGTIAKGGTPVCRARCFPVGKVLDFMLPEFLDCTARTGLEMLCKHFYQAASTWVVFFVPETDADISFYNEFLHYLGEKQRAAVAKLGEKTTLFLVPPSDFSEKVLKVPGKMSISGVILRFQNSSSDFGSPHHPLEAMDSKLPSFHSDIPYPQTTSTELMSSAQGQNQSYINSASEPTPPLTPLPVPRIPGKHDLAFSGNNPGSTSSASISGTSHLTGRASESLNENRYYLPPPPPLPPLPPQPRPTFSSSWSPHQTWNSNPGTGSLPPQVSNSAAGNLPPQLAQETNSSQYTPGVLEIPASGPGNFTYQETRPGVSSTPSVPSLQPEQLAHLASLLGKRQQSLEESRNQPSLMNQSEHNHSQPSLMNQLEHNRSQPSLMNQLEHNRSQLSLMNQTEHNRSQPSLMNPSEHNRSQPSLMNPSEHNHSQPSLMNQSEHNHNQPSLMNQSKHTFGSSQKSISQSQSSSSDPSTSQFSQVHQILTKSNASLPPPQVPQKNPAELLARALERQGNPPLHNTGGQEETDPDPQKRLQATLQLAATLLQQIQQQSKGGDQR